MLPSEVLKLSPPERWLYFIQERESIRLKREASLPPPWTDDSILQQFKFTNVRRMDDRVSLWLERWWYGPFFDHENMIVACTIARQLNNTDSLEAIGYPIVWHPSRVEKILNQRVKDGKKNFSAAYMITGTLGGTKVEQIVRKVVTPLHVKRPKIDTDSMEKSVQALLHYAGFSTFIAGQVVADMRWAVDGRWLDKYTWAPIGPGSRRGMNRFLERPLLAPMRQPEFLKHLRDAIELAIVKLPVSITSRLEAIDYQSCFCEFDKHSRALYNQGRPKQLYPGTGSCLK